MNKQSLYGLVVCGGQSTRMGHDKGWIDYHGTPQVYYVYEMLEKFCDNVYISCNSRQANVINSEYNILVDKEEFQNSGPITALLTAFDKYSYKNFIVIGCDYPLLTDDQIQEFIKSVQVSTLTSAFYNCEADVYEPMLAYYSAQSGDILKYEFKNGNCSLQKFLQERNAEKFSPDDNACMKSVNTSEEEYTVRQLLKQYH